MATAGKSKPLARLTAADGPLADRRAALADVLATATDDADAVPGILAVLADAGQPAELRRTALQTMQAAAFSLPGVEAYRKQYVTVLRGLTDDPDQTLRERALGVLARDRDGPTQKRLLAGLEKPEAALVQPEKALQLLSYDPHAGAHAAAEKVVADPPNPTARREALRLLGSSAAAAPLLLKTLRDKSETAEIRQICAAALNVLNPQQLLEYARDIVLDDADTDPDVNAMSLTALTNFGNAVKLKADAALHETVTRLRAEAPAAVQEVAGLFLRKFVE